MAQILHGSATTTEAVRRAIQSSQESIRTLANRYSINPKTVVREKGSHWAYGNPSRRSIFAGGDEKSYQRATRNLTYECIVQDGYIWLLGHINLIIGQIGNHLAADGDVSQFKGD